MAQREPTIASILQELAQEYDDVVAEREIFERVLRRRPSRARDPFASIRERLRFDAAESGWVRLGDGTLMPLRVALAGLRFRVKPDVHEAAIGALLRTRLTPFVPLNHDHFILKDSAGLPLPMAHTSVTVVDDFFGPTELPALDLSDWMRGVELYDDDSIVVTIEQASPLTLRLEHEPRWSFRADDVRQQEQELLDSVVARVANSRSLPLTASEAVLPAYARASWRTAYPGRPWQELVASDPRLQLINGLFINDRSRSRSLQEVVGVDDESAAWEAHDTELLASIDALQRDLLESRREAAALELWNGLAPRISTARMVFDSQTGESTVIQPDPIDALRDYVDEIEDRLRKGVYGDGEWGVFDDDPSLLETLDMDDAEWAGIPLINDLREFIAEHPALAVAARRLMAALSVDELQRLQQASTGEEVQHILAARFHRMLPEHPEMFATLVPYTAPEAGVADFAGGAPELEDAADDDEPAFGLEEWEEDAAAWDDDSDEETTPNDEALTVSHELMERFYAFLIEQGKSEATAASRTGDLWIYADFLASYYAQTLAEGAYATLDECLFFFYPRRVANSSPRGARELCTSLKQFYGFLRAERIADDRFAREMWRRRDQVARIVELYERIDVESPQFERLFVRLFAPYTV